MKWICWLYDLLYFGSTQKVLALVTIYLLHCTHGIEYPQSRRYFVLPGWLACPGYTLLYSNSTDLEATTAAIIRLLSGITQMCV